MSEMFTWDPTEDGASLRLGTSVLAQHRTGEDVGARSSPRPYLHPVRTLGGRTITQVRPPDHVHHLGASLAVSDVNGTTFWGGRTYVPGLGSTMLDNHGRQVIRDARIEANSLRQNITWLDVDGNPLLEEIRTLSAATANDGWALDWHSTLSAAHADVLITSSATRGRTGAGYGGIFWRFSGGSDVQTRVPSGEGEEVANGCTDSWLDMRHETAGWNVRLFQRAPQFPWFVRDDYAGAGPALAWSEGLKIKQGSQLSIGLTAQIRDLS